MLLRTTLRRISTRTNAALLLVVAALACGWAWHGVASPVQQHIDAGLQKLQSGEGVAAAIEWREAVKLDPSNTAAWELLGDYYQSAQDWPSALEAFGHVQKLKPETPKLNARLAACALASGDIKAARGYAEAELRQDADDVAALRVAASVSGTQNRRDEHLKYLQHLSKLQPQDAQVLLALALELSKRYDYASARPLLDRALAVDPGNAEALSARAEALFSEPTPQNLQQARSDWGKVLALRPGDVETHRALGRVAMLQGRPREAIAHFEAVGRGRPYASAHFIELARAYRKAGQPQKAEALRRRFVALQRQNVTMQNLRDHIAVSSRDIKSYLQMAALQIADVEMSGDAYELYRYRYWKGQIRAPEFYLAQARRLAPHDPQVLALSHRLEAIYAPLLQAGLSAIAKGDLKSANAALDHAKVLRPEDARTRSALQKIAALQGGG